MTDRQQRSVNRGLTLGQFITVWTAIAFAMTAGAVYLPDALFWLSLRPLAVAWGAIGLSMLIGLCAALYWLNAPLNPAKLLRDGDKP